MSEPPRVETDNRKRRTALYRGFLLGLLLAACLLLVYHFHYQLGSDILFTHFFYLPVVLAGMWWEYRGLSVAAFLSAVLLLSHVASRIDVSIWLEAVRCGSLLLVGTVVAELRRRWRLSEEETSRYARDLERMVEERTRELQEKNRELEAYSYTISHDITAPLVVIEGYVDLLLERKGEVLEEGDREYLERIRRSAERIEYLARSLLEYARAGTPAGEAHQVNPREVLLQVFMERDAEIAARGVEVILPEEMPPVELDPLRLQQVFSNLLDNSLKFMGENPHPRIEVGWEPCGEEGWMCIRFADNGKGIERDRLKDVFKPFCRLSSSEEPGLGIGLSTVRRAVEGWGGEVWVESEPGKGATFFLTAPRAQGNFPV